MEISQEQWNDLAKDFKEMKEALLGTYNKKGVCAMVNEHQEFIESFDYKMTQNKNEILRYIEALVKKNGNGKDDLGNAIKSGENVISYILRHWKQVIATASLLSLLTGGGWIGWDKVTKMAASLDRLDKNIKTIQSNKPVR